MLWQPKGSDDDADNDDGLADTKRAQKALSVDWIHCVVDQLMVQ